MAPDPPKLPAELVRKLQWRLVPPLWLGFAFNVINRSNLSFATIEMSPALGLSQADFGFAAGIFFCSYALMQVPSNMLLSRVGARRVLSADLIAWGLISSLTGFVQDANALQWLRFLLGLAQSGYYSGCMLFLRSWFPARECAHAIALYVTSGAAGIILSSLSSGVIMSAMDGLLGLDGWRWLFVVQGAPPLLLGCLLPQLLSDRPSEARWLSWLELQQLQNALDVDDPEGGPSEQPMPIRALRAALCQLNTWLFMLQYFALNTVTYTVMFFLPVQLSQIFPALAPWQIGVLNAVPAVLKIALGPPVAQLADRHDASRLAIAWGLFAICGGAVLGAAACMLRGPALAVPVLLLLATLCEGCAVAIFWSVHHRRQAVFVSTCSIALVNSFGNLGGFAGTFILGYLHDALAGFARAPATTVSDWGWGTGVIGVVFVAVTCTTATLLRESPKAFQPLSKVIL